MKPFRKIRICTKKQWKSFKKTLEGFCKKHWKFLAGSGAIVLLIAIWLLPSCLVEYDQKDYVEVGCAKEDKSAIHDNMINAKRAAVIQVVGGALFVFGMYVAFRRAKAMEKNAEAAQNNVIAANNQVEAQNIQNEELRKQNDVIRKSNRETLTLEQYVKAVEQLKDPNIAVRIGGIYLLKTLMKSEDDEVADYNNTIIELLTAYVEDNKEEEYLGKNEQKKDVQAAITVLGKRVIDNNEVRIDYKNKNLDKYDLNENYLDGANLEGAFLTNANLENANFSNTNLKNASLYGIILKNTILRGANLNGIHTNHYKSKETDESRTVFIKELEKAKDVYGIQLDSEIMDIIKKDFPELWKRIKGNKQNNNEKE